jgi:hypothetical protein
MSSTCSCLRPKYYETWGAFAVPKLSAIIRMKSGTVAAQLILLFCSSVASPVPSSIGMAQHPGPNGPQTAPRADRAASMATKVWPPSPQMSSDLEATWIWISGQR